MIERSRAAASLERSRVVVSLERSRFVASLALSIAGAAACQATGSAPAGTPALAFSITDPWPEPSTIPTSTSTGPRVVVTNNLEDTISFFDARLIGTPDFVETARLPVGLVPIELEGPHHAAPDPAGRAYYVGISNMVAGGGSGPHGAHGTGTADGYVLRYRASDHERTGTVRVDPSPGDVVVSPDGKTVFISHFNLQKIAQARPTTPEHELYSRLGVIDAETMTKKAMVDLCPATHGMAFSDDGSELYAACYSDQIAIVNLRDPSFPVRRVGVAGDPGSALAPAHEPYALTVSPANGDVWVSCLRSRSLRVIDPRAGTADSDRVIRLQGAPIFGAFDRTGSKLFMAVQTVDEIVVIDPVAGTVTERYPLAASGCFNVHQIILTADERYGLVVCEGDHQGPGSLHVLDLMNGGAVQKSLTLGIFPDFVGILEAPR